MKKVISILLILCFCLFNGCGRVRVEEIDTSSEQVTAENGEYEVVVSEQSNIAEKEDVQREPELTSEDEEDIKENKAFLLENRAFLKEINQYYGMYEITEFLPNIYYGARKFDVLPEQEADMLLGCIVEIQENSLVTYDSVRALGTSEGREAFPGNYMIEKFHIENPLYVWETLKFDKAWYKKHYSDHGSILAEYDEEIEGRISVQIATPFGAQEYFVMEDKILMLSTLSGQAFLLEKLDVQSVDMGAQRCLSVDETAMVLQEMGGTYEVVEFLPTKFYPALDSGGDVRLPQEEADMMIGREIVIGNDWFTTYDNFRLPNSEFVKRLPDEHLLELVEIPNPNYQIIEEKPRNEIYGLRDEMLSKDLVQKTYIEISVFPGYDTNGEKILPQLYLLDDGRIIMFSMGEYFLLEKRA